MNNNLILQTDSYKLSHWKQYPKDTKTIYSYFESREGATYPYTVFFGLQYILKEYLEGQVVTEHDVRVAADWAKDHFGDSNHFNLAGWMHIVIQHGGKLPIRIKAVEEGTVVPTGNVLMTVENTCEDCFWLTNALESLLTHVWYTSTVATRSRAIKEKIKHYLDKTGAPLDNLDLMLQDFGYRGVSSHETGAAGGAAHLVNFKGTDTLPALLFASQYYHANPKDLGFSVPATEHSVMTALGEGGEFNVVEQVLNEYPEGVLSVVADSYDTYRHVITLGTRFKNRIKNRNGLYVVRPDSVTAWHRTPQSMMVWIVAKLCELFGSTENEAGYKVIDAPIRVLWGDGIDDTDMERIMAALEANQFSVENIACFGMGGGLLQKVNRDTQRFAFKCSARQDTDGVWHDIYKTTPGKQSKKGRLNLVVEDGKYKTLSNAEHVPGLLRTVFENGVIKHFTPFDKVRENARV